MKTLTLSLKKPWFDKIKSGEKKEEYRECSEYWISRFSKLCGEFVFIYSGTHPHCICERRVMISSVVFYVDGAPSITMSSVSPSDVETIIERLANGND